MENIDFRIEEARKSFMALYKKQRVYNNIAMGVVIAVIIVIYVVLQAWLNQNYYAIGAVAVALGLLFVYSRISRSKMENFTKNYIRQYYELMKEKAFPVELFPTATMDFEKKLDLSVFTDAGILKNIARINSRGVITFDYRGQSATVCDMAAYTAVDGKQTPSFLGKFLSFPLSGKESGRLLIYIKPKVQGKGPDDIDDLKKIEETDRWTLFAKNDADRKYLPSAFFRLLESLEVDEVLVDAVIAINPKEIKVALSYTDSLMVIPLQTSFEKAPSDKYAKDLRVVLSLIDSLK